jgi:hypothetical protein
LSGQPIALPRRLAGSRCPAVSVGRRVANAGLHAGVIRAYAFVVLTGVGGHAFMSVEQVLPAGSRRAAGDEQERI